MGEHSIGGYGSIIASTDGCLLHLCKSGGKMMVGRWLA
jgi:hypothetical protein